MNNYKELGIYFGSLVVSIVAAGAILFYIYGVPAAFQGAGGITARGCSITHTTAAVGNQASSVVLSANSRRAWAVIEQPINATNTVSVSFDEGAAATAGNGYVLTTATTTSPVGQTPGFGQNADFAYMGEVEAITGTGSTTVLASECIYTP